MEASSISTAPVFSAIHGPFVSDPQVLPGFGEKSGIFKVAAHDAEWLSRVGLSSDSQANMVDHGGVDRALCQYCADHYQDWSQRYPDTSLPFAPGVLGENISTYGVSEEDMRIGDVLRIGEAVVQVTQPRKPCTKIDARIGVPGMARTLMLEARMGWLMRVVEEGWVPPQPTIEWVERGPQQWSVAAAWRVLENKRADIALMDELRNVEALAQIWKDELVRRINYWQKRRS
ncbi:MOSC domain-containing protein [Halomonas huangheensis]|uniref:MOSC domain-containing protein n=1 Tax=Halomonas huangheensis TaxID=1178482 RepID=W1N7W9_9GAMM|nr:MOSC domain-containing protein [Halomonas huangheensis]ALM53242.1 hypothetical protein AR456_13845 [Halomonas huangheensis]ERL51628.1 hypothetical protein BJB45_13310 [Halomonas huangheensis]